MKISGDWLHHSGTQTLCAALTGAGRTAHFVGGCVRNALIQAPVSDIDVTTDAPPGDVTDIAQAAGFRVVPTGIDHGTVTVIAGGRPHEVTTWRRDVATDGRRATIAFASRLEEDARRRDFTMNALYATPDGTLVDPLNGLPDLLARRVRFIEDATRRIREDYLRSLRFFRFHAWYGDPQGGIDPDALAAIAGNLDGLERLSRERVTAETVKLLSAADPAPSLAAMQACGMLNALFGGGDARAMAPLVAVEGDLGLDPDPMRRLAALGFPDPARSLRLSRTEQARLSLHIDAVGTFAGPAELAWRHDGATALGIVALRAALLEQPADPSALDAAARGAAARFPVAAADLMPDLSGPALGRHLRALERHWIDHGFAPDRAALLALPVELDKPGETG